MQLLRYFLSLAGGLVLASVAAAQPVDAHVHPPLATASGAPKLPDTSRSPVHEFRELLAMTSAKREEILAVKYGEEQRKQLRRKIQEYGSMPDEEREGRLRLVELRWYLLPLMQLSSAERGNRLAAIPEDYRSVIEDRLKQWDLLSPALKKEVLEHEWTVHYFIRMESRSAAEREESLRTLSPEQRKTVEEKLAKLRALPSERRQRMYELFHDFFELPPNEKEKTLGSLNEADRQKMEASLGHFERLSPEHRKICLEAFQKFTNMSPEEQAQFLKNAERWKAMSAQDREAWRNLVTLLPAANAPTVPGYEAPPVPMGSSKQRPPKGESKPTPSLPGSN